NKLKQNCGRKCHPVFGATSLANLTCILNAKYRYIDYVYVCIVISGHVRSIADNNSILLLIINVLLIETLSPHYATMNLFKRLIFVTSFLSFILFAGSVELTFELPDNAKECFYQEIEKNTLLYLLPYFTSFIS
ncbi:Protein of unknown function, partial [Cotesia congregata]